MPGKLSVQQKRNITPGVTPSGASIAEGELALNLADKKLFSKDHTGAVFEIGGGSNWTSDGFGAIYRGSLVGINKSSSPLTALEVVGTVSQNTRTSTGAIDPTLGQVWTISGTTNPAISFSSSVAGAISFTLVLVINSVGTVTWPSNITWPAGTAPALSGNKDVITLFTLDGGSNYMGSVFALDVQ